jgi:DNA processing protein
MSVPPRSFLMSAPRSLSEAERLDWLRLIRSENVGPITFFQLLRRFGSAAAALDALPELARRGGRTRPIGICPRGAAEREIAAVHAAGARLAAFGEADYPPALMAIDDAPPLLGLRGHGHLVRRPCIGIVGARNASALGVRFTRELAAELTRRGLVVVSGLARGIDRAAHEGALAGGTIAVLGGGIDVVYPPEHEALHAAVAEGGLLVAELPPGTQPKPQHFPRRNRLISGISRGVVVVEAALQSGSLITARLALEQGREVFAVPGSPLDPRSRGANDLIRQGATLIEGADDVMRVLAPMLEHPLAQPSAPDHAAPTPAIADETVAAARAVLVEKLSPSPVALDELIRQCALPPALVQAALIELELAGRAMRHPGGQVSLA